METALNIASFVFLGTLAFGVAIAAFALWGYLSRRRYKLPTPTLERLSTRALDAARHALELQKTRFYHASGDRRTRYGHEVQRLEMRIQHLQRLTNEEQFPYYQLCRRREKVWKEWHELYVRLDFMHGRERRGARIELALLIQEYRETDKRVTDERHRARARDDLNLQELKSQGVLVLEPEPGAASSGPADSGEVDSGEAGASDADSNATGYGAGVPDAADPAHEAEDQASGAPNEVPSGDAGTGTAEPVRALAEEAPIAAGAPRVPVMHQDDFALPDLPKAGHRYADPEFSMAAVPGGMVEGTNLTDSSFAGVSFKGVQVFRRCHFAHANLSRISLPRAEQPHQFVECDFSGADFTAARLDFALFVRCVFPYSTWTGAKLDRVKFADCNIDGTRWDGLDLSRVIMSPEMLSQGEFSQVLAPPRLPTPTPVAITPPAAAAAEDA